MNAVVLPRITSISRDYILLYQADEEACREKYTKQIQALQVTLDTEREKLMWTNEKMKELSTKLSLSDRNHMNAAKQAQEMQVYYIV